MKSKILVILMALLIATTTIASADTLKLTTKDASWTSTTFGTVTLTYNSESPTFDYTVNGTVPLLSTQYALIYYADKPNRFVVWGGDNPGAVIGVGTSDGSGNISFAGSKELNMNLPHPNDANFDTTVTDYCAVDGYANCYGAKFWLVPTIVLTNGNSLPLVSWTPVNYLFETDLIKYTDTEIVVATASICKQPTIGISFDPNSINFGYIHPGTSSVEQLVNVTITQTPEDVCANVTLPTVNVEVGIELGAWTSTEMSTNITTPIEDPVEVTNVVTVKVGFTATATKSIVPGTYTQTITVTQIS